MNLSFGLTEKGQFTLSSGRIFKLEFSRKATEVDRQSFWICQERTEKAGHFYFT